MIKLGYTIALVFMFLSSGCSAAMPVNYAPPLAEQVLSIQPSSVMYGIRAALAGHAGTGILTDGTRYLFTWSYPNMSAIGFFGVDSQGKILDAAKIIRNGGNLANSQTVSGLIECLKSHGWRDIAPSAVPTTLVWLAKASVSFPVMIFTVGVFGPSGDFETWFNDTFLPVETQG